MRTTEARLIAALVVSAALVACGPGSEVGSAEPSVVKSSSEMSVEPSSSATEASVGPSSERSVGSAPGASVEPSSGIGVVEDPRFPAPVLTGWDPSLSEFAGTPPPVVFASLFDGRLPAVDPAEIGGVRACCG